MILNRFYCGDALKLIKQVKDGSIDLIICDGPYGVTENDWDRIPSIQQFNLRLLKTFKNKLKEGGSLYLFGKPDCLDFVDYRKYLTCKSKIIWYQPSRLAQGKLKYTNNYDIIYYFVKGKQAKCFNLDDIRIPQLVELTHRTRCENVPSVTKGKFNKTKFNPLGKNPGDVWGDVKQLTYKSKELVSRELLNTIQKPEKLIERMVLASSNEGDTVLDPFSGVGTTAIVSKKHKRNFIAFEINKHYIDLSKSRLPPYLI